MSVADHTFWMEADDRLQEIARTFEEGVTIIQPERVTSRRLCPCLEYTNSCGHPLNGNIEYYEYRGEQV